MITLHNGNTIMIIGVLARGGGGIPCEHWASILAVDLEVELGEDLGVVPAEARVVFWGAICITARLL